MNHCQLIFNSFPRSGNVFMSNVARQTLSLDMISSVHIPEIYQVKEIFNVAIFRNPEESIASLLYKQLENTELGFDIRSMYQPAEQAFLNYQKYVDYATKYSDNIHIINFNNAKADAIQEIKKIVNRFNFSYLPGKENLTINDISFENNKVWGDSHDGHMPREKSKLRLEIDNLVSSLDFIAEAVDIHKKIVKLAA
jgi:hypothetical protein